MTDSNQICFGPFLIPHAGDHQWGKCTATGSALEFVTTARKVAPIYKRSGPELGDEFLSSFSEFCIRSSDLPCDVLSHGRISEGKDGELMIELEDVLLAIHRSYPGSRPVREVVEEFRARIPGLAGDLPESRLRQDLVQAGFRSAYVFSYGRTLTVNMGWTPRTDIGKRSPCTVGMGYVEFRPRPDRTLGQGRWIQPRFDILGMVFRSELRKIAKGPPISFFSQQGIEALVAQYPWKPIALLNRKQLQEAKVSFIRQRPELHSDLSALAKAMIQEGLYSEGTDRCVAKKFARKVLDDLRSDDHEANESSPMA